MTLKRILLSYGIFVFVAAFLFLQINVTIRDLARSHENDIIDEDKHIDINLAYVLGGSSWTRTWFLTHLKSVISHSLQSLNLHIIIDQETRNDIEVLLKSWNLSRVNYHFYDITPHLKKVDWIPTYHYSKQYALAKILLPDILDESLERVILLDVDTIFHADVLYLWNNFRLMNESQIFGVTENLSDWYLNPNGKKNVWPALGRGFNAGVMLIDLKKLRNEEGWEQIWRNTTEEQLRLHGATTMADQDIFNSILSQKPAWAYKLSCGYNYQLGVRSDAIKLCNQKPKIVHFNSENKSVGEEYGKFELLRRTTEYLNGETLKLTRNGFEKESESTNDHRFCGQYMPHRDLRVLPNALGVPKWHNSSSVCLCVQLSIDRMNSFVRTAKHWPYFISASIYGDDEDISKMLEEIKQMNRTNLAVHLIFKSTEEKTYPINFLRNTAIRYAMADSIVLADVDFLILGDLENLVAMSKNLPSKETIVIPAFEMKENIYDFDNFELPQNKSDIKNLIDSNKTQVFRENIWPTAHRATNLEQWLSSNETYEVFWEKNYEPYIVLKKSEMPYYDERFGGFGWNKVTHVMELKMRNFTFIVSPSTFMLHQPHSPSPDLIKFRASLKYRQCLQYLKQEFIRDAKKLIK